jgi:hypothetical protein
VSPLNLFGRAVDGLEVDLGGVVGITRNLGNRQFLRMTGKIISGRHYYFVVEVPARVKGGILDEA